VVSPRSSQKRESCLGTGRGANRPTGGKKASCVLKGGDEAPGGVQAGLRRRGSRVWSQSMEKRSVALGDFRDCGRVEKKRECRRLRGWGGGEEPAAG